jgi:ABC-type multidrug transport system fused ATPase/permease subunit
MGEIFETVQASIGEKYANLIFAIFTGIGGCLFAFYTGQNYSLSLIAYLPVFFIILGTFGIMVKKITTDRLDIVKQTGGVVSETLYAIKVVASFGREELELKKFKEQSKRTEEVGKCYQRRFSFMVAIMKFAIFSFYTFSFYVGSLYIQYQKPNKGDTLYSA